MTALATFQDAFAQALLAPDLATALDALPPDVATLARQPAFAVYRNTVTRGAVDALCANFPSVQRAVGDEWLRAAATLHVREHPPSATSLLAYGEAFPSFLAAFPPAADLPWLADVARLDRAWTEAHGAPDQPTLEPAAITVLAPAALAAAVLVPHAAARWLASHRFPIHALWSRNRRGEDHFADVAWTGEAVLVTRPRDAVRWIAIDAAHAAFLDACTRAGSVAEAIDAALAADRNTDLARLMTTLLDAGAFTRLSGADERAVRAPAKP